METTLRTSRTRHLLSGLMLFCVVAGLFVAAYRAPVRAGVATCGTAELSCAPRADVALSSRPALLPVEDSSRYVSATAPLHNVANRAAARGRAIRDYGRLPLGFEENRGQADADVRFLSRAEG